MRFRIGSWWADADVSPAVDEDGRGQTDTTTLPRSLDTKPVTALTDYKEVQSCEDLWFIRRRGRPGRGQNKALILV
ncbi:hypothetical protein NHX12_018219 [Muraenolepis orangiensis]|uniref:Uncharacterized protein n=1 Tax=Muraenolepis orangiensis TaxID=630683 RepID=A0A9Q0EXX0_9TELE|nr:hypothetical protein NHX12_018219 [Muraenolepis orangiensis]